MDQITLTAIVEEKSNINTTNLINMLGVDKKSTIVDFFYHDEPWKAIIHDYMNISDNMSDETRSRLPYIIMKAHALLSSKARGFQQTMVLHYVGRESEVESAKQLVGKDIEVPLHDVKNIYQKMADLAKQYLPGWVHRPLLETPYMQRKLNLMNPEQKSVKIRLEEVKMPEEMYSMVEELCDDNNPKTDIFNKSRAGFKLYCMTILGKAPSNSIIESYDDYYHGPLK